MFKLDMLTAFQKVSPSKIDIENKEFDLNQVSGKLFRGYNGLGTSFVVFHKPS